MCIRHSDDTQYYIKISPGAVVDEAASPNSFAGIESKDAFNFTTKSVSCGSISGVVRYKNGKPVNGSTVKLYKDDSLITTTTTNSAVWVTIIFSLAALGPLRLNL